MPGMTPTHGRVLQDNPGIVWQVPMEGQGPVCPSHSA